MKTDWATVLGLVLAVGGISAGLVLEGGSVFEILQPTAALIVFGGTVGATLVAQPMGTVRGALRQVVHLFAEPRHDVRPAVEQIVKLAQKARRMGIVSLDKEIREISDPFLKKAVMLAVDGTEPKDLRQILENEIDLDVARHESEARVLEIAGGFAPTIGIIGAVLGLIQVMKHLQDIDEVGKGIAVAFVATIYGVGAANLLLLPGARKIADRAQRMETAKLLMLEGAVSLAEGHNPRLIRSRLEAFVDPAERGETDQQEHG